MFPLSSLAAAVAEAPSSHRLHCPYMSGAVAVIFSAPRRYESVRDSWQDAHRYSYSSSTRRYSRSHRRDRHSHSHCCSHATATSEDFHLFVSRARLRFRFSLPLAVLTIHYYCFICYLLFCFVTVPCAFPQVVTVHEVSPSGFTTVPSASAGGVSI